MVGSHKLGIRELSSSSVYHEALYVDERARFLLAHGQLVLRMIQWNWVLSLTSSEYLEMELCSGVLV